MYSTRFQGSKRKIAPWLIPLITDNGGQVVLDGFSGSGIVSYLLAKQGKQVTSCDLLHSAYWTLRCFITDRHIPEYHVVETINEEASQFSTGRLGRDYKSVFYLDKELEWLDGATEMIRLQAPKEQASLYWPIFQAALSKRPFNLFHRSNLDMRTRNVSRSFGNKKTWDTPFPVLFRNFASEARKHIILDGHCIPHINSPENFEDQDFDIIYLDPPYVNSKGQTTSYNDYYSFLDLLCEPDLQQEIDLRKKHKPMIRSSSQWSTPSGIVLQLRNMCQQHPASRIVLSYRSDGLPTPDKLLNVLATDRRRVRLEHISTKYVLAQSAASEILVISEPA